MFRPHMNALFRHRSGSVRHIVSRIAPPHASEGRLRENASLGGKIVHFREAALVAAQ
jgi:hypothetical protein